MKLVETAASALERLKEVEAGQEAEAEVKRLREALEKAASTLEDTATDFRVLSRIDDAERNRDISGEMDELRKMQIAAVMPNIGHLLDTWDGLPNDLKSDPDMEPFQEIMTEIDSAMEGEQE